MDICERCMRMNKCSDYKCYVQPSLFPAFVREVKASKDAYRKDIKPIGNMKAKDIVMKNKREQLIFNL